MLRNSGLSGWLIAALLLAGCNSSLKADVSFGDVDGGADAGGAGMTAAGEAADDDDDDEGSSGASGSRTEEDDESGSDEEDEESPSGVDTDDPEDTDGPAGPNQSPGVDEETDDDPPVGAMFVPDPDEPDPPGGNPSNDPDEPDPPTPPGNPPQQVNGECGNGEVDPGEDCEGDDVGGQSCEGLGFASGDLACTSGCSFDTSGCEGTGEINASIDATRGEEGCAAPCAVFFDASESGGLADGDFVNANFSWTFGDGGRARGFLVAHVFHEPGSYPVEVLVRDKAGAAGTASMMVEVTAMPGEVVYVSSDGSAGGAGTIDSPVSNAQQAINGLSPGGSVLLRRGDTFQVNDVSGSGNGPFLVGAYSDPDNPSTERATLRVSSDTAIVLDGSDWRLQGIHFTGMSGGAFYGPGSRDVLIEDCEFDGTNIEVFTTTGASNLFIFNSHSHDFNAYGVYGEADRLAIVGSVFDRFSGGEHGMRLTGGSRSYIANNYIHGEDEKTSYTFRGEGSGTTNDRIVFTGNRAGRWVSFMPQNSSEDERISLVTIDGNVFEGGLTVAAQTLAIRNNRFWNGNVNFDSDSTGAPNGYVRDITFYNNTMVVSRNSDDLYFIGKESGVEGVTIRNNMFVASNPGQTFLFAQGARDSVVHDSNLLWADGLTANGAQLYVGNSEFSVSSWESQTGGTNFVGDPGIDLDADPGDPYAFSPRSGSAAVNSGSEVPVYSDALGNPRPADSSWDVGAIEL